MLFRELNESVQPFLGFRKILFLDLLTTPSEILGGLRLGKTDSIRSHRCRRERPPVEKGTGLLSDGAQGNVPRMFLSRCQDVVEPTLSARQVWSPLEVLSGDILMSPSQVFLSFGFGFRRFGRFGRGPICHPAGPGAGGEGVVETVQRHSNQRHVPNHRG